MTFTPTTEQQNIYDDIANPDFTHHIMIRACAGSGKTTTLLGSISRVPAGRSILFTAFSNTICNTLKAKVPPPHTIKTTHQLGYGIIRQIYRGVQFDAQKGKKIVKEVVSRSYPDASNVLLSEIRYIYNTIVPLLKANLYPVNEESVQDIMDSRGIYMNIVYVDPLTNDTLHYDLKMDTLVNDMLTILKACKENYITVDYDDMIWLPVVMDLPSFYKYRYIYVDEWQDLTKGQLTLLKKFAAPNTRIIGVGDEFQAIYHFRGAYQKAMEDAIKEFKMKVYPLSYTFRCPVVHVNKIHKVYPVLKDHIRNLPSAKVGVDGTISEKEFHNTVREGDVGLCRMNYPLVKNVFQLILQGKRATILGRDIGKELSGLVNKITKNKPETFDNTTFKLTADQFFTKLLADLKQQRKNTDNLEDKMQCIMYIASQVDHPKFILSQIDKIFSDEPGAITFITIHRAKGLEFKRVFLFYPDLFYRPKKSFKEEDNGPVSEELNCAYVGYSRSFDTLIEVLNPQQK